LHELLRRRGDYLFWDEKAPWQGTPFLAGDILNAKRDNVYTFMSGEIGLRELGSTIREDADIGHILAVRQEIHLT
jgi:hypothetical protein